jgi:hypothetical protein
MLYLVFILIQKERKVSIGRIEMNNIVKFSLCWKENINYVSVNFNFIHYWNLIIIVSAKYQIVYKYL